MTYPYRRPDWDCSEAMRRGQSHIKLHSYLTLTPPAASSGVPEREAD